MQYIHWRLGLFSAFIWQKAKSRNNAFRHVSRGVFALGTVRSVGDSTSAEKLCKLASCLFVTNPLKVFRERHPIIILCYKIN